MNDFGLVVIGGSSGSHRALRRILLDLPADLPAPIFIATHMSAASNNLLASMLDGVGPLPVRVAEDGEPYQPGHVYVAVADCHLLLIDGTIRLGRGPRENMSRPAIDPLFRSAALVGGPRTIGVILTGMLNDGASGLASIKRMGGRAVVQDPRDAVADDMPLAAIEACDVDVIAPLPGIGAAIARLIAEPLDATTAPPPADLRIEVEIALGARCDSEVIHEVATPSTLTCPACNGVLSEMRAHNPLRFRCQVGHGYTGEALYKVKDEDVDEALRVALRVIDERADLVTRMARDARDSGRPAVAEMYEQRSSEYRSYAETIRRAVILNLPPPDTGGEAG